MLEKWGGGIRCEFAQLSFLSQVITPSFSSLANKLQLGFHLPLKFLLPKITNIRFLSSSCPEIYFPFIPLLNSFYVLAVVFLHISLAFFTAYTVNIF